MNDNEIIRGVPFEESAECFKEDVKEYFDCYKKKSDGEDCIEVCLIRGGYRTVLKAEQEINRQRAEVENLKDINEHLAVFLEEARAEIERLEIELKAMRGAANSYMIHYENALQEIERLKDYNTGVAFKHYFDGRAEAIREFAERLKEHSTETIIGGKYKFRVVTTECIDNLVKEMTEEAEK